MSDDPQSLRLFTVEEVNQLIPTLKVFIQQLQNLRDKLLAIEVEIDALELITESSEQTVSVSVKEKMHEYKSVSVELSETVRQIQSTGGVLKDLEMGLIDFYAKREDDIVYLCWKPGETEITHWHHVGEGFAKRKEVDF